MTTNDEAHAISEPHIPVYKTPQGIDLQLGAAMLLLLENDLDLQTEFHAALVLWKLLTGLNQSEAMIFAQQCVDEDLTAYLPTI